MLRKIDTHAFQLHSDSYFYDSLNNSIYFLKDGSLHVYLITTQKQHRVDVAFNSEAGQSYDEIIPKLQVVSGDVVINTQKNIVSNTTKEASIVRSSIPICNGMKWEFHAPLSLYDLSFGVCKLTDGQPEEYILFEYTSSSARTVTFEVKDQWVYTWVNGSKPSKCSSKPVGYDDDKNKYYPCVQIKEIGNTVIFSPFSNLQTKETVTKLNPFNGVPTPELYKFTYKSALNERKLIHIKQLSKDSFLLIWEGNFVKVINRNQKTNKFQFSTISIKQDHIHGLLSKSQHATIHNFKPQIFEFTEWLHIPSIYHSIQVLLSDLDEKDSTNYELYELLLRKLLIIRPYLNQFKERIPNVIGCSELDLINYAPAQKYFEKNSFPFQISSHSVLVNSNAILIDGRIEAYTQNYILSRNNTTINIYHVGQQIKQVFSQDISSKYIFHKSQTIDSCEQSDLNNLRSSQESFLYKILSTCLHKEKKSHISYVVNSNDVKEMVEDYKTSEVEARIALEHTGNVEQAMVWLANDHNLLQIKKLESKKLSNEEEYNICLVQIGRKSVLSRLLLQINSQVYVLGVSAKGLKDLILKGEKEYINLLSFKHETTISDITSKQFYNSWNHRQLCIQDQLIIDSPFDFLAKCEDQIYAISTQDGMLYRNLIQFQVDHLYEKKCCISQPQPIQPLSYFVDPKSFIRSIQGEIVCLDNLDKSIFQQNTVACLDNTIYSNAEVMQETHLLMDLSINKVEFVVKEEKPAEFIPLLIEHGPPGCNLNYPICSILYPKSSFLANYPYEVKFRQLHSKYMKITSVLIERISRRKNVNSIKEGYVYFTNNSERISHKYHFLFDDHQDHLELPILQQAYWKYMIIAPKFSEAKRMPYQIGFVGAKGYSIEHSVYSTHLEKIIKKSLQLQIQNHQHKYQIQSISENSPTYFQVDIKLHSNKKIEALTLENANFSLNDHTFKQIKHLQIFKKQKTHQNVQENDLQNLTAAEFNAIFLPKSERQCIILREVARNSAFSFQIFSEIDIKKFIDIALYFENNLRPQYCSIILQKIFNESKHGKQHILNICNDLIISPYTIPVHYLQLLSKKMTKDQHLAVIKQALQKIPQIRSNKYSQMIKSSRGPYLLLETQFYSSYYLDQIDKSIENKRCEIYEENAIRSQIITIKENLSRRIIVKLEGKYQINQILLRFDRSQLNGRANFKIYSPTADLHKVLIAQGRILEHQFTQITKYPYKAEMEEMFANSTKVLNAYGIDLGNNIFAKYLEIQIAFSETGIVSHQLEVENNPQIDIIPEAYGVKIDDGTVNEQFEKLFTFNEDEKFFISNINISAEQLQKYSITKNNKLQYIYYKPVEEDIQLLKSKIQEKFLHEDYTASLINLHKKYASNKKSYTNKLCLDYLYTVLCISLEELENRKVQIEDEKICQVLFKEIIRQAEGPVKIISFRSLSHHIHYLIKSLQFLGNYMPNLKNICFTEQNLYDVLDLHNIELCSSLCRFVIQALPYENKWAEFLLKIAEITYNHSDIIAYILPHSQWIQSRSIVEYFSSLNDTFFENNFLTQISNDLLSKYILQCRKLKLYSRVELLIDTLIKTKKTNEKIDLDIISIMFEQPEIKWNNLFIVSNSCSEAIELIINQYLQTKNHLHLAKNHPELLFMASASLKHEEQFANFLIELLSQDISCFKRVILQLPSSCTSLHSDLYQYLAGYLQRECHFGGIEGAKLLCENQLISLQVAVQIFRLIKKWPIQERTEEQQIPNQQIYIEWYLRNNLYQLTSVNPANRSPGLHLIKTLSDYVLDLLKDVSVNKILKIFNELKNSFKNNKSAPLSYKHLGINQIHEGVSKLLNRTISPASLADVLIGKAGIFPNIISELKESLILKQRNLTKWNNVKQIDLIEKFSFTTLMMDEKVKDMQANRMGNKSFLIKVPVSTKRVSLVSEETVNLNKFIIGFVSNDTNEKNNILPFSAELYGGESELTLCKIADLKQIEDQHYLPFGIRVFAVNFNTISENQQSCSVKALEVRLQQPFLSSTSEAFENLQRNKKNSVYSVSFISAIGYETQPKEEPNYSQMYMTLLTFLSQAKYRSALQCLIKSSLFDQKLELIIQVFNDLLPNQQIQELLIALNEEGVNILEHILKSKGANWKLIKVLLISKLSRENINKVITYTLANLTKEYVDIVVTCLRLASYQEPVKHAYRIVADLNNIVPLLLKYEEHQTLNGKNQSTKPDQCLYFRLITSLLTVPNIFNYDLSQVLEWTWKKDAKIRRIYYPILAAILPYHDSMLNQLLEQKNVLTVFEDLSYVLQYNRDSNAALEDPFNQIYLLSTLATYPPNRELLVVQRTPIQIVNLIRSTSTLLIKYSSPTMKYFISFFQSTCIESSCAEEFSQILIELMTTLTTIDAAHHQYFIYQFFFPLINAYNGIPVNFIWKGLKHQEYFSQLTEILKYRPIRSSEKIILIENQYYSLVENQEKINFNQPNLQAIIQDKNDSNKSFKYCEKKLIDISGDAKQPKVIKIQIESQKQVQSKLKVYLSEKEEIILPNEQYNIFTLTTRQQKLLTNDTLQNLKNPLILEEKYKSILPIQDSTYENVYFLPIEMTVADILKHINICGYKLLESTINANKVVVKDYLNQSKIVQQTDKLLNIAKIQKVPYIKFQIQADLLFKYHTVEKIALTEDKLITPFIPQETIFKAFERKRGLEKMITVLITCVKNWKNEAQSKIWIQYLKELESYSCFPVFSSIYMNKQQNVQLLFDLLSGLPDKEDNAKWLALEKESVKFLYSIIKDVFTVQGDQAIQIRQYAVNSGFYKTMLERLHLVTKEIKRVKQEADEESEEEIEVPIMMEKKNSEDEYKKNQLKKKKGIGYGTDSSSNQKWDLSGQESARKELSQQILGLLNILQKYIDHKQFNPPAEMINETFESAILPILQSSLRGGSLLEISKYAELFRGQLQFIQVLAKSSLLIAVLMPIPKIYQPKQSESIHSLLKTLSNTANIFLSCLSGSVSEKETEEIAKSILQTYNLVDEAISKYQIHQIDQEEERKILELPLAKKYPLLMKDLRFDYVDMKDKSGKISKHHYGSYYLANHKSPAQKTIRLAQELADVSHALPIDHTNAIFVRCDKERVDYMQALIMGSNGTPYGHGAYLFDIYFEDTYPNAPPKVNLTTTGTGQIRFNPNLYACGKVCLSLLGTWRGNATENWDAKVSTLLQVLVSIQSIIMSEEIYFNEPGFQHEQGTPEGEKKNQAYANVVRYGNIKFAMIENIKNPPKGFENIIRRHFYLKKQQILEEVNKWLKFAEKREASYTGLVSDHNNNWCTTFKKSKTQYKTMLEKAIRQLEIQLNKLPEPTAKDLLKQNSQKEKPLKKVNKIEEAKDQNLDEIDVTYDKLQQSNLKELDINDEKVKDRWSRYIGAMGIEAVSKQSKANVLLFGIGAVGVEIAKNIILSGCRQFSIYDDQVVQWNDLSGQFFVSEEDVGKPRIESCLYKLQQLNNYVKVNAFKYHSDNLDALKHFHLIIMTGQTLSHQLQINQFCNKNKIKFIIADCFGPYGQIFNDFGQNFEVLDKNGEETVEVMIENITNDERGLVTLVKGQRHPYEDGEAVRISGVKGMVNLGEEIKENNSINGSIHKVKVKDQGSFYIGDTRQYTAYDGNGLIRNLKLPSSIDFKNLSESVEKCNIDANLEWYDFTKGGNNKILHQCILALSAFRDKNEGTFPKAWDYAHSEELLSIIKLRKVELTNEQALYARYFSFTCSGTFAPICAFYGGLAAQQAFKAITGKYMPINQYYFTDFTEVLPTLSDPQHVEESLQKISIHLSDSRLRGIQSVIGDDLLEKIQFCKVFLIGSGAIGCELLKNYAMINLATGQGATQNKSGCIIVTDPDHIETSNLNRQFLFREKHLRKSKSATASAAVMQMNKLLKGRIRAKLDKVCQASKDIFSNQFFENLTIVTNALDNVQARQYVDIRCVQNKVALLESGTLSSKGHVQVIIPYKTESYGSKNDPAEDGEIPHCTLKMFPEETLHCVEWARDIFGKNFTLKPKALIKLLDSFQTFNPSQSDCQMLADCFKMLEKKPSNFDDAVYSAARKFFKLYRNDIKQLLYTYPLDAKTKDGKPFWKLPKRPPTPIEEILPEHELHNTFITSYAVLLCKIYNVPFPNDFRLQPRRIQIANQAAKIKIQPFTPSDKLAQEMSSEVNNQAKQQQQSKNQISESEQQNQNAKKDLDYEKIFSDFKEILENIKSNGEDLKIKAQEFQKDEDQNGHIDLIYSMANLRAQNYKLERMDWITTKLKAGRITPALSTTTSCIAALQTIELIKYLKNCKLDQMRNTFINLAVPLIQFGQPGEVQKIKIHQNLITNIWQRWEIGPLKLKTTTIGQFFQQIEVKYGVQVKTLSLLEGGQIYSDLVLGLESKKNEKQQFLKKTLSAVLSEQISIEDVKNCLDFTLVLAVGDILAKHVPTLRVLVEK